MVFLRRTRHIASTVILLLTFVACALALSQATQPEIGSGAAQQPPKADPRGTDASPLVIQVQPTSKTDEETAKEQAQIDQQESAQRWTKGLGITTGIVGFLQLIAIGFQVYIANGQNRIIEKQSAIMEGQLGAAEAGTTIALAHKRIGDNTLATQREIERAYIVMSHSGAVLADSTKVTTLPSTKRTDDDNPDAVELVVEITNHGRTPGDVLGGFYGFVRNTAIGGPDLKQVFGGGRLSRLFVLPNATVDFGAMAMLGQGNVTRLISEDVTVDQDYLWFIGEIDYCDRFGTIHRSMYCRRYSNAATGFVFGPETGALNYDRKLTDQEIDDRGYNKAESQQTD